MTNPIHTIEPFRTPCGGWAFDDAARKLSWEALVAGSDAIMTRVAESLPGGAHAFRLLFCAGPFHGHQYSATHEDRVQQKRLPAAAGLSPATTRFMTSTATERAAAAEYADRVLGESGDGNSWLDSYDLHLADPQAAETLHANALEYAEERCAEGEPWQMAYADWCNTQPDEALETEQDALRAEAEAAAVDDPFMGWTGHDVAGYGPSMSDRTYAGVPGMAEYGDTYTIDPPGPTMTGWLCPALLKYFDVAPKKLYFAAHGLARARRVKLSHWRTRPTYVVGAGTRNLTSRARRFMLRLTGRK